MHLSLIIILIPQKINTFEGKFEISNSLLLIIFLVLFFETTYFSFLIKVILTFIRQIIEKNNYQENQLLKIEQNSR